MIEVTFRIESLDYTDKLDSQLPLVLEALSQSGNINPVLKLACNTPEASSRIVKGILRTMSQDQKQRLATKIVNANREKLMRKLNEYAAGKGIDVHICDCAATFRRGQSRIMPPERAAFCCLCPDRSAHRQQSDLIRGGPFAPSSAPAALSSCPGSNPLSKRHAALSGGIFICRGFILPSRACTSLPHFVCA